MSALENSPIRIAVVDDHSIIRAVFRSLVEDTPDLHLLWTAGDLGEARKQLGASAPDLLVLDITLPDGESYELAGEVVAHLPHVRILMISTHDDPVYSRRAQEIGAIGFVNKNTSPGELLTAIHQVHKGIPCFAHMALHSS